MKLSKAKIKEYVDSGGVCCPFCGGNDLSSSSGYPTEDGIITQLISCGNCPAMWIDVFRLITIKEVSK